jgi:hypothetical protein
MGVFNRIFAALAGQAGTPKHLMIDATHLKAHRTAASLLKKGMFPAYRSHERRPELKTPCGMQRPGKARFDVARIGFSHSLLSAGSKIMNSFLASGFG